MCIRDRPTHGTKQEKILAMTQATADRFAAGISAHPQDWHMLQRLWLSDLDPERVAAEAAAADADPATGRP
jgi:KDO2-lipid IV(A) lauroyltransferase